MTLLDTYLPEFTFREFHQTRIRATADKAYRATRHVDLSLSRTVMVLFRLRGLPTGPMTLEEFCQKIGFTRLEAIPDRELVIGFWVRTGIEKIPDKNEFIRDQTSRRLKVVWNFKIDPLGPNSVNVSTETRILCTTTLTKLMFGAYWTLIRPFSGLIRIEILKLIRKKAEDGR